MLIAQITDLHIKPRGRLAYGVIDTAACLERCVAHLNGLQPRPDLVLATGDLVDSGTAGEYGLLRELLQPLAIPCVLIPGNHDAREPMRAAFPGHRYLRQDAEFLHHCLDDWPVRLIGLDTLLPDQVSGLIGPRRLAWLRARLAEAPARPTLIYMHHPPFATGIAAMDRQGLAGAEALAALVAGSRQVQRIVCGHVHRPIATHWAGVPTSIAPSTAHQVALHLADQPLGFVLEPPGYQLHLWNGPGGCVTHTAHVGAYPGPYPFREQGRKVE
ncbi:MAG: phosphodiesterase [Candidatus Lambdaproteobacteria bacterium]|nr:phosphodiesterase [Candidatus Lambdaproteobacteria bacterium]